MSVYSITNYNLNWVIIYLKNLIKDQKILQNTTIQQEVGYSSSEILGTEFQVSPTIRISQNG